MFPFNFRKAQASATTPAPESRFDASKPPVLLATPDCPQAKKIENDMRRADDFDKAKKVEQAVSTDLPESDKPLTFAEKVDKVYKEVKKKEGDITASGEALHSTFIASQTCARNVAQRIVDTYNLK